MSILVLTSDTLIGTPATGNIEYNGQFYGTDSNASRAQLQRITQGTAVASTSGTSIDFTGLPAWVKRVTVILNGVSTSGTSNLQCRIGVGTVTTSGYTSTCTDIGGSNTTATSGYICSSGISAASVMSGVFVICLNSSNRYAVSGTITRSGIMMLLAGDVTLSGALDIVRITTVNGTDTFDAGSINILYEG
jgi:hypothetical protein